MAIEVIEKIDSRESTTGRDATVDLKYIITGTSDDIAAKTALAGASPGTYDGLHRQSATVEPVGDPTETLTWSASVRYARAEEADSAAAGSSSYTFDTAGGTRHVTQSRETVSSHAADGAAPDFHGAIGVTRDAVEGVDVVVPTYQFTETHAFTDAEVDEAFKLALFRMTGKVNADAFRGFEPGEVLFMGASGSRDGGGAIRETGDAHDQLAGYENLTGVSRDNSDAGTLYVSVEKIPGLANYNIRLYKDAAMNEEVGHSLTAAAEGTAAVDEVNDSGLGGSVVLGAYVADTDSIRVTFPFPWRITFRFSASGNAADLTVGGIGPVSKKGWEYMWVRYADDVDDTAMALIKKPVAVYIEKVYEEAAFGELGI